MTLGAKAKKTIVRCSPGMTKNVLDLDNLGNVNGRMEYSICAKALLGIHRPWRTFSTALGLVVNLMCSAVVQLAPFNDFR
jgi:hypothetical protein